MHSNANVLPHMRILAYTRMGHPICMWNIPYAYGISRMRMEQCYVPWNNDVFLLKHEKDGCILTKT